MKHRVLFVFILLFAFSPWTLKAQTEIIDLTAQHFVDRQLVETVSGTNCTIDFALGSNSRLVYPRYYDNGTAVRVYYGNTITVTATGSSNISEIDFTFGSGGNSNAITASTGSYANGVWTGNASTVTFQVGGNSGHRRLQQLTVTYVSTVAPPVISGTTPFSGSTSVSISTTESGAAIYYTKKGGIPTSDSTRYTRSFTIYNTTVIKAVAKKDGIYSNVTTQVFESSIAVWTGSGTHDDPFLINNATDLDLLATNVNNGTNYAGVYFKVTADISYSCTSAWNDVTSTEDNYTRIGTSNMAFEGIFDGDGHTISGIRVCQTGSYNYGLFGYIGGRSVVKNITLANCRFKVGDVSGAISGRIDGASTVENCHVLNNVCIQVISDNCDFGGIVGLMRGGNVKECTSSATLSIKEGCRAGKCGGVVSIVSTSGILSNCLALGAELPEATLFTLYASGERCIGAIVGELEVAQTMGCLYYGCIFGSTAATIGIGKHSSGDISNAARLSYTLTSATEGVTLHFDDDEPNPDVVEVYPFGLAYGGMLYAAENANVSFSLSVPEGLIAANVSASSGTLTDNGDGTYTLVIPAEDVTVSATLSEMIGSCEIRYELHDNSDDGWEGAAIQVVDVIPDTILATWTIGLGNTASGTLAVDNGQEIRFQWVSGSNDNGCSYTVYNAIDEELFSGSGAMSASVNHTVNCNACPNNYVLNVTDITPTSAVVNWPERASAYNIRYRPLLGNAIVVLTAGDIWEDDSGYQMLLDADATAYGTIFPETGGLTSSGDASTAVYDEFEYKIPENADGSLTTSNVLIDRSDTIQIPSGIYDWCITNPSPDDRVWIASENGNVGGRQNDFVFQAGHIYEFVVSYDEINDHDRVDLTTTVDLTNFDTNEEWTAVSDVHSPYAIAGLSPDTWYEVQVQADCGAFGTGEWKCVYFHTPSACAAPTELESTDILSDGATLGWSDYQDSYNVRYRTAANNGIVIYEGFEDGNVPDGWTTIDADGDGYCWSTVNNHHNHSGERCATSASYINYFGALTPDNWLITPQLELRGTMRAWLRGQDGGAYAEHFAIYLSTTGTNISDFTTILVQESVTSNEYVEYTADLSSYAGQQGYIAIRHFNTTDQFYLNLDDFGIYTTTPTIEAGEWQTATVTENTLVISGLSASTKYEWQVQGVDCDGNGGTTEWSESAFFTTALPSVNVLANQWYAIAAPTHDDDTTTLDVSHVTGLTDNNYDFFRYNEANGTWENQKESGTSFSAFDPGRGYIYRRTTDATLTFNGIPNSGSYSNTLTNSCPDLGIRGFNLIGNPYPHAIYKGVSFPATSLTNGFYSLETNGTWLVHQDTDPIGIGQGVLVQVDGDNDVTIPFTDNASAPAGGAKAADSKGLQFTLTGLGYTDMAFALFDHRSGLRKVSHLNSEAPALSIPIEGTRYAIATIDGTTEAFPLAFSGTPGEYTLTASTISILNSQFSIPYLHLIDRVTAKDIDLLRQPTYTFSHSSNQAIADRFLVRLRPEGETGIFAYQNGNSIVVEGTGMLQVFDVMGRQLFTKDINSQFSIFNSQFPTGVYILRLNGKTQKIVIR